MRVRCALGAEHKDPSIRRGGGVWPSPDSYPQFLDSLESEHKEGGRGSGPPQILMLAFWTVWNPSIRRGGGGKGERAASYAGIGA